MIANNVKQCKAQVTILWKGLFDTHDPKPKILEPKTLNLWEKFLTRNFRLLGYFF
jgi:hypothetical protein